MPVKDMLAREVLAWRARHPAPWRNLPRGALANVALVILGMAGAVVGGRFVGVWMMGLVIMAESALLIYVGFSRDDGASMPVRGSRTPAQVLDDELATQRAGDEIELA